MPVNCMFITLWLTIPKTEKLRSEVPEVAVYNKMFAGAMENSDTELVKACQSDSMAVLFGSHHD